MKRLRAGLAVAWAVQLPVAATAIDNTIAVTSEAQACEVLKQAAVAFHLSARDLTGRYYCEPLPAASDFYVLALRYSADRDELVGSNLIGHFAVVKSNGKVLDWDINEDRPAPLAPRAPFEEQ